MNWDPEDKKLGEFLKGHRPLAPKPHDNEAKFIWSKIFSNPTSNSNSWSRLSYATAFALILITAGIIVRMEKSEVVDLVFSAKFEQTMKLELDSEEEMKEVDDLIALASIN